MAGRSRPRSAMTDEETNHQSWSRRIVSPSLSDLNSFFEEQLKIVREATVEFPSERFKSLSTCEIPNLTIDSWALP